MQKDFKAVGIIILIIISMFTYKPFVNTNMYFIENLIYERLIVIFLFNLSMYFMYKTVINDLLYKEIEDKYTVPILIFGLLTLNYQNVIMIAGILVILRYISALILKKEAFGEADIIILAGLSGFYSNIISIGYIFLIACITAILYYIFKRDRQIPFIPFILIGVIIFNIYQTELLKLLKTLN